jgi:hypothetical protein
LSELHYSLCFSSELFIAAMIEELLERTSPKVLVLGVIVIFVLAGLTTQVRTERQIRSLGGHTTKIKTWLPFGSYLILSSRRPNSG